MDEFQLKRLQYFIKAAEKYEWVRLAPLDAELINSLILEIVDNYNAYDAGYIDGYAQVLSLPEASEEDLEKLGLE